MEEKLFDIPVYICSMEEYNKSVKESFSKLYRRSDMSDNEWEDTFEKIKELEINHRKMYWYYNAIIGYISVYKSGMDLVTTLSIDRRKRKIKGGTPDIWYDSSTFFRVRIYNDMTSQDVMKEVDRCIDKEQKTRLKNRYVDMESFHNFCKYIDWNKVFYSEK